MGTKWIEVEEDLFRRIVKRRRPQPLQAALEVRPLHAGVIDGPWQWEVAVRVPTEAHGTGRTKNANAACEQADAYLTFWCKENKLAPTDTGEERPAPPSEPTPETSAMFDGGVIKEHVPCGECGASLEENPPPVCGDCIRSTYQNLFDHQDRMTIPYIACEGIKAVLGNLIRREGDESEEDFRKRAIRTAFEWAEAFTRERLERVPIEVDGYDPRVCIHCNGHGRVTAHGERVEMLICEVCNGTGKLTDAQVERVKMGLLLREDRVRRKRSLREEAQALGVTVEQLARVERGIDPPDALDRS